eukprot:2284169-Alexandrium_andersonii.AAC.1
MLPSEGKLVLMPRDCLLSRKTSDGASESALTVLDLVMFSASVSLWTAAWKMQLCVACGVANACAPMMTMSS